MAENTSGEIYAKRDENEMFWVARQPHLNRFGYDLRPRYQPDWQPSWGDHPEHWIDAEDAMPLPFRFNVIDAVRLNDQSLVYIKVVRGDSEEVQVARYLRSEELQKDPRNCCVPILDVLQLPGDENLSFMVMPFLRYIDSPPFELVGDVLQCGGELLKGLEFLHEHNIAHRDCAFKNVMMDARTMYPQGHHPILNEYLPDCSRIAPVLPRAGAGVKYYFTDFGISTRFAADEETKLVLGRKGLDDLPPELSDDVPYDPFKLDVYILGNLFREKFTQKYRNLSMLDPLVGKMTARDPAQRPTAQEALHEWQMVQENTAMLTSGWRLQPADESALLGAVRDTFHPLLVFYNSAMSRLAPPAP